MRSSQRTVWTFSAVLALSAWPLPATSLAQEPARASAPATPRIDAPVVLDDRWMVLEISGSRVGHMNVLVERVGEDIRTSSSTVMSIGRGEVQVNITMATQFIETADGRPIKVVSTQTMGQQPVETIWVFAGDKINQISRQGGRETTAELNAPKSRWLTPNQADVYARAQRQAGAETFTFATLDPQNGIKPITATSKRAGTAQYDHNGKHISVQVWKTTTDVMPIEAVEYCDDEGEIIYQEIPTGIGKITMRAATKEVALAEAPIGQAGAGVEGAGGGAPDVMLKSFAKPSKPIENSLKATSAKLKIIAREGVLPELPSAGAQRVEMSADRTSAVLTIDINDPLPAQPADLSNEEYRASSSMVDYGDPIIAKLASKAAERSDLFKRAEDLREIAHDRISKKGLATAFASASETARTRAGDCSEHGVLLAALLRAEDIPSRVAMGLVYAPEFLGEEGIFGWHMWTQALVDGKWVDLDATLPVRYSAAHVLTSTASLADGMGAADMASIMQLIGNIDIEVIEVGYDE